MRRDVPRKAIEEGLTMQCCPICGHPFSPMDVVLGDSDIRFQCHHCWSRVHSTGPVSPAGGSGKKSKVRISPARGQAAARKK